ncbi:receptor-like cytoplasmic kinase 176 [Neltuma alba]|uniref:receptor-like cytoplasmic kinase 176 n=1 Tax=Neltuma alba TaxID=207710 RepID=UPI0010A31AF7|nr:receptor-like cytoplasmic kinase 176 [Prosopis alba]
MGCCYSARMKSENPSCNVVNVTHDSKQEDGLIGGSNKVSQLKIFKYDELKTATRIFHPHNMVGEGGSGKVFKGWLDEQTLAPAKPGTGIAIAVKKLNQDAFQGHKESLVKTEINVQGQLHHPNIVKLLGCCLEDDHRLLVHEFLTKRSLEYHLSPRISHVEPLSWSNRKKIALDAAKALAFLHSDEVNVIYRDLKASHILLDSNFNAKLSDSCLAKDGSLDDESHCWATGTHIYAAPEYTATGRLIKKCDVYSFGVVLLEILSGKRAFDRSRLAGEQNLVAWAKQYFPSKCWFFQVMDARIKGQYLVHEAMKVAKIAIQCLSDKPQFRPTMADVVGALELVQDSSDTGSSSRSNDSVPKQHQRSTNESLNEAGTY